MNLPFKGQQRPKSRIEILLTLLSVGFSAYVAYVNTLNLHYNREQAFQSSRIANQLSTLNRSQLIWRLNNELCKKKEKEE